MKKFFAVVFALVILAGTAYAADEDSWDSSEEEQAAETQSSEEKKAVETQSGLAALAKNPDALRAAISVAKARAQQKEMAEQGAQAEY